jgi:hypothetical protein
MPVMAVAQTAMTADQLGAARRGKPKSRQYSISHLNQPEVDMTNFIKAAGLAGILVAVFATVTPALRADQLHNAVREGHGVTTELGANASAITYWVSESDGWHVVTTVDSVIEQNDETEKHAVVRFSSVLLPGQSQLISVPFALGERQQVLRIRRLGDQIEVARVPGSA